MSIRSPPLGASGCLPARAGNAPTNPLALPQNPPLFFDRLKRLCRRRFDLLVLVGEQFS